MKRLTEDVLNASEHYYKLPTNITVKYIMRSVIRVIIL